MGSGWNGLLGCALIASCTGSGTLSHSGLAEGETASGETGTAVLTVGEVFGEVEVELDQKIASLVRLSWEQRSAAEVQVHYRVVGEEWRQSPPRWREPGPAAELLLGLPFEHEVEFKLVAGELEGEVGGARTGALPAASLVPTLLSSQVEAQDPTLRYVLGSIDEGEGEDLSWSWILDRQGRLVWALPQPANRISLYTRPSADGSAILVDHNSHYSLYDGGAQSSIQRVDIQGRVLSETPTPGLHHAFLELDDGSLVWGAMQGLYVNETLEILSPEGEQSSLWDCMEEALPLMQELTYCGSNTISYDAARDRFLYSFYSLDTIFEIDAGSGDTTAIYGHLESSWAFEPAESAFWFQHGPVMTDQGTLLLSTKDSESGSETLVREYALEEGALREVWSVGEGQGVYASTGGEVHRLPSGNVLHNFGSGQRLREYTPEGEVAWDVEWRSNSRQWLARTTPLEDLYAFLPEAPEP